MKLKSILVALALILPSLSVTAAETTTTLKVNSSYTTGSDSMFEAVITDYQSMSQTVSVLTIVGAKVADIKEAKFLDKTGWVILSPYQSGPDVAAKFISDTGFDVAGQRVITMRVNFNTPNNYVIGYTIVAADGRVLSSTAAPISVTGQVLGTSTSQYQFTRALSYGRSGDDVRALQERLTAEGVYTGPITGYFGSMTRAAVKKYQTLKGIRPVSGIVGPLTLAALNQ